MSFSAVKHLSWNSLVTQWLSLCTSTAGGMGLIPGQETKITQHSQNKDNTKKHLSPQTAPELLYNTESATWCSVTT